MLWVVVAGCGASAAPASGPTKPLPLSQLQSAEPALARFGQRLYAALARGKPFEIAFDAGGLRNLLLPEAEHVALVRRAQTPGPLSLPESERALWAQARYAEICIQQGRVEPRAGTLGLRAPGFVFERALLVGREPGGGALAAWVEGEFLHTDAGFGALSLERIEAPRRDHSDLELAVCELRAQAKDLKPW